MIPYDIDPSLHTAEPEPQQLDDGFSPPHQGPAPGDAAQQKTALGVDAPGDKSPF